MYHCFCVSCIIVSVARTCSLIFIVLDVLYCVSLFLCIMYHCFCVLCIIVSVYDCFSVWCIIVSVARTCSLIFIVLDVLKPLQHKKLIEHELEGFGIRLNKAPPNIGFRRKEKGGINLQSLVNAAS
jgi:ribosome-interacting GTPase 1